MLTRAANDHHFTWSHDEVECQPRKRSYNMLLMNTEEHWMFFVSLNIHVTFTISISTSSYLQYNLQLNSDDFLGLHMHCEDLKDHQRRFRPRSRMNSSSSMEQSLRIKTSDNKRR